MKTFYFVNRFSIILILSLISVFSMEAGVKPKWLTSDLPIPLNDTYTFIRTTARASSIEEAKIICLSKIAQDQQLLRTMQVQANSSMTTQTQQEIGRNGIVESTDRQVNVKVILNGRPFDLKAQVVDEYYEQVTDKGSKLYEVSVLYMVGYDTNAIFDNAYVTTRYGAEGLVRSIVPGWGQFYKGQKARGGIIIGAQAVTIAGIIYSFSMKSSYEKYLIEDPKHASEYSVLADTWTNVGYGFIAAAAGVYLYNLLDAALAPGAARVIVSERGSLLTVIPAIAPEYVGVGLVYKF